MRYRELVHPVLCVPCLSALSIASALTWPHSMANCLSGLGTPPVWCAQELREAFPGWGDSAYADWIETYSSQDFEVR